MKFVSLSSITRIAACAAVLASTSAYAGGGTENFDLTFSGAGFTGSLDLTGTAIGNGEYDITSATGTINGLAASLLGTSGLMTCAQANCGGGQTLNSYNGNTNYFDGTFLFDNVVYTGTSTSLTGGFPLDNGGLAFSIPGDNVNVFSLNGGYSIATDATGGNYPINASLVAAVPEPSTYLMMLLGLVGIGYAATRRNRAAAKVASPMHA